MSGRIDSEAEIIEEFLAPLAAGFPGALGLADDAALLTPPAGQDLVLTTDAVAADVHFFAGDRPEDIAWRALAVNMSDLAAKGAAPLAYLMVLSFPEAPERAWLARFAAGLKEAQAAFGLALAGGDTDRRPGPLTVTITAIGSVATGAAVRRSGAQTGDRLYVSGTLGDAALGLKLRRAGTLARDWGLDGSQEEFLIRRYDRPEPRLALAPALRTSATASIDISDGFAKDLSHLCRASKVAGRVRAEALPVSAPVRAALAKAPELFSDVIAGGGDYEVLATVPPGKCAAFVAGAAKAGVAVAEIGLVVEGAGVEILRADGNPIPLDRLGWDHF